MPETAKRTARVPILGEDGRISDDYIPAAIGEGVESAEAAATRAETAATAAEGSAAAAGQSAAGAQGSASAAGTSATQAQQSATTASGAATQAQSAQQAAEAAKTGAESARDSAQTSASQAQQSAASVADKFIVSAQATTLDPGSQATASVADQVLTIGVPKGEKGDKGETGDVGPQGPKGDTPTVGIGTVETLPAGSPATASATTTNTGVNINFGIPKGDKGDTGDQGPQGEPGQDGQDATLPEGMVTADGSVLSRLGSDGEPSIMTDVMVGNTANGNSAMMRAGGNSPSVMVVNSQTGAAAGFGLLDGEPVLSAKKPQSDTKVYGFSPTIPEDDILTVVTSDAYKADTDPLKQRIAELEQQTQNVVTGTSTDLVAHGEDAFPQKPREVRIKGKTWVNRWPVLSGTHNGVTVATDGTGLVTVTGTATADADVTADVSGWAAGKSYTTMISVTPTGCSAYFEVQKPSGNTSINATTTGATLDVASDATNCVAGVHVTSGATVNASFRVMLVDGTEAPDCFTPCASITSVQPEKLVTSGKNLINVDGASVLEDNFGVKLPNLTLQPGSYVVKRPSGLAGNFAIYLEGDTSTIVSAISEAGASFTLTSPVHGLDFRSSDAGQITLDNISQFQLELGSTATSYEPPTITTTPLPEVELRSLPNGICDELVIKEDGTCEVERKIVTLNVNDISVITAFVPAEGPSKPYVFVASNPFESTSAMFNSSVVSDTWPSAPGDLTKESVYRTGNGLVFVSDEFADKNTALSMIKSRGGTFVFEVPDTTEPQSPVILPVLPAPTFNQYHDSPVPSDTSTEYVRDINIVLDNLAKQIAGTAATVAINEATR